MNMTNGKDYTFHVVSSQRKKRSTHFSLKLTSMIDMFTILLVFLLKSYSTEGHIMSVAPDLRLPQSSAQKAPETTSIVAVTADVILLDGHRVASVSEVIRSSSNLIPELQRELVRKRTLSEQVGKIHQDIGFTGKISIQGDRELPYAVIKKIMFTCGKIGYNDIMLAVTKPD
ncbi:MAG TPA: biopolymer transporter ExbD [bacterium]|nr:biopolymer transporter ExbD [bacterium]